MSSRTGPSRLVIYGLLGVFVLLLLAGTVYLTTRPRPGATLSSASSGQALIGGPFTLSDHNGATVTDKTLLGRPSVLFFGFTHCPEVCPTTLHEISMMLRQLGDDADRINVAFVSVDPERDTAELMRTYLSSFDPHIRGLTGPLPEIEKMARAYRVYFKKVPLDGGDYTMDHTALVYLFDGKGKFVAPLNLKPDVDKAADQVRALLAGS